MKQEILMTLRGRQLIENELEQLIKVEREKIKTAISEARALGDLKENAEYHSAKEKQSHIEGRIAELQGKIAHSQVVDTAQIQLEDKVVFGAKVTLYDAEKEESMCYHIVGENEAKEDKSKIFYLSPLGLALIGKEVGDTVTVRAPKGDKEYEIETVSYA